MWTPYSLSDSSLMRVLNPHHACSDFRLQFTCTPCVIWFVLNYFSVLELGFAEWVSLGWCVRDLPKCSHELHWYQVLTQVLFFFFTHITWHITFLLTSMDWLLLYTLALKTLELCWFPCLLHELFLFEVALGDSGIVLVSMPVNMDWSVVNWHLMTALESCLFP